MTASTGPYRDLRLASLGIAPGLRQHHRDACNWDSNGPSDLRTDPTTSCLVVVLTARYRLAWAASRRTHRTRRPTRSGSIATAAWGGHLLLETLRNGPASWGTRSTDVTRADPRHGPVSPRRFPTRRPDRPCAQARSTSASRCRRCLTIHGLTHPLPYITTGKSLVSFVPLVVNSEEPQP